MRNVRELQQETLTSYSMYEAEYAKAILYGQVATTIIGCIYDEFVFSLPFDDELGPHDNGVSGDFISLRCPKATG